MTSFHFGFLRRQIANRSGEVSGLSFPSQTLLTVDPPTPRPSRSSSRQMKLLCDQLRKYPRRALKSPEC